MSQLTALESLLMCFDGVHHSDVVSALSQVPTTSIHYFKSNVDQSAQCRIKSNTPIETCWWALLSWPARTLYQPP